MDGSQHYIAGERLLSDASFIGGHGYPVKRDGSLFQPGEHEALIGRAQAHFAAALAAAQALPLVVQMMGDCDEVTKWARAIGWTNESPARGGSEGCEICGCGDLGRAKGCIHCICHAPKHTCSPFDEELDPNCVACTKVAGEAGEG